MKTIEREGRTATPNEQTVLSEFSGWGTVAAAFSDDSRWQKEAQQLRELLTADEYTSARNVVKGSFFTSPGIARAVWKGIERLGFKGGNILDPSMGTGIFFGTIPQKIAKRSKLFGVELDSLTGRIANQLCSQINIWIRNFRDLGVPENVFDLAISNVPFDAVSESGAHDYFFVKSMNALKPGGLLAFITSAFTLDNDDLKDKLGGVADLIAAFKLPNTTFADADTKVTSDLLIFQKRVDPVKPSEHAQPWREVGEFVTDVGQKFTVNEYFIKHRDHMIGTPVKDPLYGGRDRLALGGKGHDVARELGESMNSLPEKICRLKST